MINGLRVRDQHHLDSAAGGSLQDLPPTKAKKLSDMWYENSRHQVIPNRELQVASIDQKLSKICERISNIGRIPNET